MSVSTMEPNHPQHLEQAEKPGPSVMPMVPLTEDMALARLKQRDLSTEAIEEIALNSGLIKSRKVRVLLASHPSAPRRISLQLIRQFHTFELMQFALRPEAPADLRRIAEELLISRVMSLPLGECLSLARRSSQMVAGALLLHPEIRVWQAALQNPRITERTIIKALGQTAASPALVQSLSRNPKWVSRADIRLALLQNPYTPPALAVELSLGLPVAQLRDVLQSKRLPEHVREGLRRIVEAANRREI